MLEQIKYKKNFFLVLYIITLFLVFDLFHYSSSRSYNFSSNSNFFPINTFDPSVLIPCTSKCIPCQYERIQTNSNGSPFDFICSVYFNRIVGLFPYVRTFRQCNKKSQIIIFINQEGLDNMNPLDKIALQNCGVTIYNAGVVKSHLRALQIVRFIYFYDFIKKTQYYFERCIFTDGFDVFFQGDPFTTEMSPSNIYLTIENETNNFINKSYALKFPSTWKIICSKNIINCGVFAGGTALMQQFFSYYMKMFPGLIALEAQTINYNNPYSDQDALNYFVYIYAQKLSLANKIVLLPSSSYFSSMIGEVRYKNPRVNWSFPTFSVPSENGDRKIALLVHQYTYSQNLTVSLYRTCRLLPHQKNVSEYYKVRYRKVYRFPWKL